MFDAQSALLEKEVQEGLDNMAIDDLELSSMNISSCNCLPACTSLTYNAETSQAEFNYKEVFQAYEANISEFPG